MESNVCPICCRSYEAGHSNPKRKSRHHIYPRYFYPDSTLTVCVCQRCHDSFHRIFFYKKRWSKKECVENWIKFCQMKGKNPFKIYPTLIKFKKHSL